MGYVDLTEEAMESICGRDLDEPVAMINLLKFRDVTEPTLGLGPLSGRDCYFGHYVAGIAPIANRLGTGHSPVYLNDVNSCFFATVGEDWDYLMVPQFPSRRAYIELITDPEYQQLMKYRSGALINSRLIECVSETPNGYPLNLGAPLPPDPVVERPGLFRDQRVNEINNRDPDEPTDMLNLVRMAGQTAAGGGVDDMTGAEGYEAYKDGVASSYAERAGVEITWRGFPVATLIGPTDELWDEALMYHYSSRSKMLSMFTDADDYRLNHLPKRNASIVDSRLIETSTGN
jgi:uncharacterized protein (DUF1330 family)